MFQMKKSDELKQKRTALEAEITPLASKVERSVDENTALTKKYNDLDALNEEIRLAERNEKFLAEQVPAAPAIVGVKKSMKDYSFLKAIREMAERGKLSGFEAEMDQEARRLSPDTVFGGIAVPAMVINSRADLAATSSPVVATDTRDFIDVLRAKLVVAAAGARVLTGLKGNLSIPYKATAGSAAWEAENGDANDAGMALNAYTMSPKRLAAYQAISKQLLAQSSYDVEAMLQNDLRAAIAIAVDAAAIEGGAANTPSGILVTTGIGSVVGGDNGAAPDWADIVDLEKEVAIDDADLGALAYLTNPKVRGKLKQTAVGTDQRMVWAPGADELNGYKAYVSTQVPSDLDKGSTTGACSAIIFGNFNDLIIGQWGGLDIVVDPYTLAGKAQVKVTVNSWWDVLVRHASSFAAMKDATT